MLSMFVSSVIHILKSNHNLIVLRDGKIWGNQVCLTLPMTSAALAVPSKDIGTKFSGAVGTQTSLFQ